MYATLLNRYDPERIVYLAIPEVVRQAVFEEEVGQTLLEEKLVRLISFDPDREVLMQWIP